MPKTITQQDKELYQCEECGFKYAEKEWAEKCESWCKEHQSCNIEIITHGTPPDNTAKDDDLPNEEDRKFNTKLFYSLIGIASSLAFFLVLYWVLRLDSAITNLITNTYDTPLYFWPYVILTLGTIVLFGINITLLVYRWRKFGPPKVKTQSGTGFGSLVGIAASACPVCGSTILSAIGIAGGLAAFPFGGLELKALSFGLMALPLWLMKKDLAKLECGDSTCPVPQDYSFKETDRPWLIALLTAVIVLVFVSWNILKTEPVIAKFVENNRTLNSTNDKLNNLVASDAGSKLFDEVTTKVLPEKGFQSKIRLGDSVVKLVENGVIDRTKFEAIYKERGGLPPELKDVLDKPSDKPILLTRTNSNYYVNLLWPVGLSNYIGSNRRSPVNGKSLFNFASTGGWNIGKEDNGGAYFNKFKIVDLTPEQEALVVKVAENTYRPCCNNSTFFQDCNHGSALLGLLQLGAAQGLTEDELYREALAFNSFWFPQNYIETALYFKAVKNADWENVDPKVIMDKVYSSASGASLVAQKVNELGLVPQQKGGAGCGV
ncbi:MAG: hypothetical protein HY220_02970 [Candidatus Sungbacteria bacterium]|uniref:Uncharacterized protein n=1 Tax=Candidatus Sungiibacteriota bacterium TaxID=2750080 RepID=A0A9D6LRX1_9BACT|nr:hypothetical protein [Candidatus Sungbacteria bacterium]